MPEGPPTVDVPVSPSIAPQSEGVANTDPPTPTETTNVTPEAPVTRKRSLGDLIIQRGFVVKPEDPLSELLILEASDSSTDGSPRDGAEVKVTVDYVWVDWKTDLEDLNDAQDWIKTDAPLRGTYRIVRAKKSVTVQERKERVVS